MTQPVVLTKSLKKYFPSKKGEVKAVDGVNLSVMPGIIFGFLGPNGAGKTTTLRMLATLMPPTSGSITISGFDAIKQPDEVRRHIGYVGQNGGADRPATGVENLLLQGRLYGMTYNEAMVRARELIKLLQLDDFADRIVYTYSGGQRRRLDVAIGIMHRPDVLFLDEPTVGLDPQNRANLWVEITKLRDSGVTIFLTTHYLEEADALSDRLTIIDQGKIVTEGTPSALKKEIGGDCIEIAIENYDKVGPALLELLGKQPYVKKTEDKSGHIKVFIKSDGETVPQFVKLLDQQKIKLKKIIITEPSLDDVFLQKTGYSLRDKDQDEGGRR